MAYKLRNTVESVLENGTPRARAMLRDALAKGQHKLVDRLLDMDILLPTPEEIIELTADRHEFASDSGLA